MFKPVEANPDFVAMEKRLLDHWYQSGIVKKYLEKNNSSNKRFTLLDGPITANNPMGVHHAWGRTYKDLWPRFFNLLGYHQKFQNGFDCQGLWVEVEVEKELGLRNKKDIENLVPGNPKASIAKFVQLCKERVYKFAKIQTEQTKRLGNFMDWEHSYYTMSDENNYMIWHFLKKCHEAGWIYKGRDSVPWCPRCETAISQHEMLTEDYKEVVHESVYFKLQITSTNHQTNSNFKFQNTNLLVWTTTPWTLPANIAVAVEPSFDYSLVEMKTGELFWIAKELVESVLQKDYTKIIKTVKGKELVGLKYQGPFDDLPAVKKVASENLETFHTVVATDAQIMPITLTEGTGLVHTAVSAGTEDFKLGAHRGLPLIPVINDDASYMDNLGFLSGKNAKKHPELILDYLREKGFAYKTHHYKHRYPACWRCKTELVWKVADEWYISMDKSSQIPNNKSQITDTSKIQNSKSETLRQQMVEVAKKIRWLPEFGLDRELDWLKNMHDWLISKKNRYWGLALPIYECKKCGHFEVIGNKSELKEKATEGWEEFEKHSPHKPFIDEVKIKCEKCGESASRIPDVGNPWLDAGIVPYSTITENNQGEPLYLLNKDKWKEWIPADFITESFPGQFKNWFYSLIAMSTVMENEIPFKTVLGFGTMLDEKGKPFHKSAGNAIEFIDGADRFGADIIRWACISENPANNILFGEHKATDVKRRFYLTLWNCYKFFVEYANLDKLKVKNEKLKISIKNLKLVNILDLWIVNRLNWLIGFVEKSLKEYNARDAAAEIEKFVQDLSTWYIRRSRDRVWVNSENQEDKVNFYSSLHLVLVHLSIILSPFLPFLSDEIYTNLTGEESVHTSSWPTVERVNEVLLTNMEEVRKIVEVGHRVRKEQKIKLRQPLKSAIISCDIRPEFLILIKDELNVKEVKIEKESGREISVRFDTNLTPDLIKEGEAREIIRQVQAERKNLGLSASEYISLTLPAEMSEYEEMIKKKTLAREIKKGANLVVSAEG